MENSKLLVKRPPAFVEAHRKFLNEHLSDDVSLDALLEMFLLEFPKYSEGCDSELVRIVFKEHVRVIKHRAKLDAETIVASFSNVSYLVYVLQEMFENTPDVELVYDGKETRKYKSNRADKIKMIQTVLSILTKGSGESPKQLTSTSEPQFMPETANDKDNPLRRPALSSAKK